MSKKASNFQKKTMSFIYRGKEIFKPLNTGWIDDRVSCIREWIANIFFYTKNGTTIMIDAGYNYDRLKEKMGWLDIAPEDIEHILLTHQDTDHVGAVERDSDGLFRKATLYLSEIENRYMTGKAKRNEFDQLPDEYSHLYYAKDGKLAAVILIEDPVRDDAKEVVSALKDAGITRIVMMTGDSERTAKRIAGIVGVDEFHAEVLPEDKSRYVEDKKKEGLKVIMVGDGINDSPALSASDAGVAISEGAEIARQIADITISSDDLHSLVVLQKLSDRLMERISFNYRMIVGFNTGLILLGLLGIIPPGTSALLHNASTIAIGVKSTTKLLERENLKKC